MIKAIIVDDETKGAKTLEILLKKYCGQVQIVGLYENIADAKLAIIEHKPNLVFLDIEMPFGNGFELIEQTKNHTYEIIFITAYNQYAINAIKADALDYLLKPIDIDELINAVDKAEKKLTKMSIELLASHIYENKPKRLTLQTNEGVLMVNSDEITHFEADSNYTYVHLDTKKKITISKTLKLFEEIVKGLTFIRVHNSYLINTTYIEKYIKGDGGTLVMKNGQTIAVSRSYKQDLLQKIGLEN